MSDTRFIRRTPTPVQGFKQGLSSANASGETQLARGRRRGGAGVGRGAKPAVTAPAKAESTLLDAWNAITGGAAGGVEGEGAGAEARRGAILLGNTLRIVIIDHPGSGAPDRATLAAWCRAMTKGMAGDFAPAYGRAAAWDVGDAKDLTATDIVMGLFRDADQQAALGYHDVGPNGMPFGKAFPLLDAQDGAKLSVTLDHEGKEVTEDLFCDLSRRACDGRFWSNEPCDAVEQDEYTIDGVSLSNFVTPGWYSGRGRADFLGKLKAPLTLTPGGYAQYFDPRRGWQQIQHAERAPRTYRLAQHGRPLRRRALDLKLHRTSYLEHEGQ